MMRTVFLFTWFLTAFGVSAQAIEIYVGGHKYDSFAAYQAAEKALQAKGSAVPVSLNDQQEDYIRQEAQKWGVNVDLGKIKTFQIKDKILHKLYVRGVENGMVGALRDFYQNQGVAASQVLQIFSAQQLQAAIQQAVTASKAPKLLIVEPGKVRILTLTTDDKKGTH